MGFMIMAKALFQDVGGLRNPLVAAVLAAAYLPLVAIYLSSVR